MSKISNEYLCYYFIEAANALRVHNAEYKAYDETEFKEVTKHQHKRALTLTARKLVRLVYALLKKTNSIETITSKRHRRYIQFSKSTYWLDFLFKNRSVARRRFCFHFSLDILPQHFGF
jgi:hypothetical protein